MATIEQQIEQVRAEIDERQRKLAELEAQLPEYAPQTKEEQAESFAAFVQAQAQIALDRQSMVASATRAVVDEIKARETPRRTRKEPAA